jgi:DNA polymerase-3 subunit epsilon
VYLAMTGGQSALALDMSGGRGQGTRHGGANVPARPPGVALTVTVADSEELRQHEAMLDLIHKSSGGQAVWRAASSPEGLKH